MKRSQSLRLFLVLLVGFGSPMLAALVPTASARAAEREGHVRAVTHACSAVQISAPGVNTPREHRTRRTKSFSASRILDLELELSLSSRLEGQHEVEWRLYTPKGHLYQTLSASIPPPESPDEGAGHRRSRRQGPAGTASATLPVAGTSIVGSSLYGEWRVEAHLDGAEDLCSRPQTFVIEP